MFYCVEPIPNCNDPQTLRIDYHLNNKTSTDCWVDRRKYISGRVYLTAALFNGVFIILTTILFVYCASGPSATEPSLNFNPKNSKQAQRRHSLQKRSILGIVLGAIGHFVFSSSVFLAQALDVFIGCELFLWGSMIGFFTWMFAFGIRAYRLRFLFRLNQLKVKYLRMSSSERLLCLDDKDYRWYLANKRNIRTKLMKPYFFYVASIFLMLFISIPIEVMYVRNDGKCDVTRPSGLIVGYYASFIVVLVPFILWYLRYNADANGIRTELWIDALVGVPFFVLYITFYLIFTPSILKTRDYQTQVFAPVNWVVFFTAAAHIISVVIPVIAYLPIQNKHWLKFRNSVGKNCRLQKRPTNSVVATGRSSSLEKTESTNSIIDPSTSEIIPELSIESLERSMADPEMMYQLQDLAIRDFSSENVLFYESYLNLETKFKEELIRPTLQPSGISRNWIPAYLIVKKQQQPLSTTGTTSAAIITSDITQQKNVQKFLTAPVPCKMYPDFIQFYETFIRENTSSQVNISYRARRAIDEVFAKIYNHYPELNPRIEPASSSYFPSAISNHIDLSGEEVMYEKAGKERQETVPVLTFGTFEIARIEVCWNIFNSVFPKLVDMYNTP